LHVARVPPGEDYYGTGFRSQAFWDVTLRPWQAQWHDSRLRYGARRAALRNL